MQEMKFTEAMPGKRKAGLGTEVDALRDWFLSKPFDQTLGAYYPSDTIEKYNLTTANRTLGFTRNVLKASGYRGWYAIVVHDKRGSTLWHPHMLLDGRDNQVQRVMRQMFPFADTNYKTAGPILDRDACAGYMATRACETGLDSDKYEFAHMGECKPHRARGSRGKGRGKSIAVSLGGQRA